MGIGTSFQTGPTIIVGIIIVAIVVVTIIRARRRK